jgi:hypothetical protein
MLETEEYFPFNDLMEIHALNLERLPEEGEGRLLDWLRTCARIKCHAFYSNCLCNNEIT